MRILLVGAGGVGDAIAKIAARRDFFETIIVSDYDVTRAERTIAWIEAKHGPQGERFVASRIDASCEEGPASAGRGEELSAELVSAPGVPVRAPSPEVPHPARSPKTHKGYATKRPALMQRICAS